MESPTPSSVSGAAWSLARPHGARFAATPREASSMEKHTTSPQRLKMIKSTQMSYIQIFARHTISAWMFLLAGPIQAQEALPENPGFTPEQAEAQVKDAWSKNLLNPIGLTPPQQTRAKVLFFW